MKTAKLFLIGMYLYLALSAVTSLGLLILDWHGAAWTPTGGVLAGVYLLAALLAVLAGLICAIMGFVANGQRNMGRLVMGWRTLKLKSIPFYILHFLWNGAIGVYFTAASRTALLPLLLLPAGLIFLFVFLSGCLGIALVHTMRRHGDGPSLLHYPGQLLPVMDVASTLFLLRVLHVDNIN